MGSKNYIGVALRHLDAPSRKKYRPTQIEYFTMSNCIFSVNFLVLVLSDILGNPKFTLGGPVPPVRPLAETFFCAQGEYFTISNSIFNFNFLALVVSEILWGPKIT